MNRLIYIFLFPIFVIGQNIGNIQLQKTKVKSSENSMNSSNYDKADFNKKSIFKIAFGSCGSQENELEIFISEAHDYFLSKLDWQNKKMTKEEMEFFEKNISEEDSSRLALRIARICASSDGFHKKENAKFLQWSKFRLDKNKDE